VLAGRVFRLFTLGWLSYVLILYLRHAPFSGAYASIYTVVCSAYLIWLCTKHAGPLTAVNFVIAGLTTVLSLWFFMAGFPSLALLFGTWTAISMAFTFDRLQGRNILGAILASLVLFFHVLWPELPEVSRYLSYGLVDHALAWLHIPFRRVGIAYELKGFSVSILAECSGANAIRAFSLLAIFLYLSGSKWNGLGLALIAICAGIGVNAMRIMAGLTATYISLSISHAQLEVFGLIITGLFGSLGFFLLRGKRSRILDFLRLVRQRPYAISATAVFALIVNIVAFGARIERDALIEHDYAHFTDATGRTMFRNVLREDTRKHGSLLLEHPIEYCLRLRGWKSDATDPYRLYFNDRGQEMQIQTIYRIGDIWSENRFSIWKHRLIHPKLWNKDITAVVTFTETELISQRVL
jgi:hypothetical protein